MKPLDAMRAVFSADHQLRESERAVLTVLILRRNNKTGVCYPGQPRIARESGMSVSGVRRVLARLEGAGIIERVTRMGLPTKRRGLYSFLMRKSVEGFRVLPAKRKTPR